MLRQRLIVSILLVPLVAWVISYGSWVYAVGVSLVLALAAYEYGLMFRRLGLRPALPILVGGAALMGAARFVYNIELSSHALSLLALTAMAWHAADYERGAARSGSDFGITLAGTVYLGWIGAYLISLRKLPDGQWWVLLALGVVWLADSAAFTLGSWLGRRRLVPRLSPKKTWEGYLAGIAVGAASGAGLAWLWRLAAGPQASMTPANGFWLGLILAIITPLGDLGISMMKREIQVKDSGALLPGHGGALDRTDSWLWAGVLTFYWVIWTA